MKTSRLVLLFLVGLLTIWAELPSANGKKDICRLPKVVGPCTAAFPRWFFNWASRKCEAFTYGGCGGNENNFKTLKECQHACGRHARPSRAVGQCPKPQGNGPCVELCASDKSCGPGEKCCSNGCGHVCTKVSGGSR
ncbi:WAP four-disulfide core domain protein 3 [Sceloporus undulatus]|uniref:WAP four-disulfide core domain protein 3 n=1 Tax=Sceloporus undulatus TaxID=8520 RepID=UPI001C4C1671|nr:WAP four-disulfide core domain protein 3 [Sceloporus undulatus]